MIKAKLLSFLIILLLLFLALLIYVGAGVILSYRQQPEISEEYQANFHAADFYSDTVSPDRAYVIEDNQEALLERLKMIEHAQERIILSTFEFRADESGKDVLAALLAASERGVRIQIIVDGAPAFLQMRRSGYFHALSAEENVEIREYNRLNLFKPWKSMGRLHDKYLIVDEDRYILGGRNTYDYFLGEHGYKDYDRDVLVYTTDPDSPASSIHQVEQYFDSIWTFRDSKPFRTWKPEKTRAERQELEARYQSLKAQYPEIAEEPDYIAKTLEVNKITLLSNPIHVYAKEPTVFYALAELMKQATGDISIHTPYVICNDWMYEELREICDRNPNTRMMTNSAANNGNLFGAADYLAHKAELLDTGLQIYEYEGGVSYHCKSIFAGDRLAIVGSFNMDLRSVYLDTELMLVIDSEDLTRQLRDNMEAYEASAVRALDLEHYDIPQGVTRQEMDHEKQVKVRLLRFTDWFRFLM